jgi:hypothetical protein
MVKFRNVLTPQDALQQQSDGATTEAIANLGLDNPIRQLSFYC